jgi:beta-glucosidase
VTPSPASGAALEARIDALLARLDPERKVRLLTGASAWTTHDEPAVGLRAMVLSDGPAGVRGQVEDERSTSANLPSPTALAATWDESLVERLGRLLAAEARRKHADVLLGPTADLQRTPLGGRHFECLSEEPLLSGRIGAAYVRGVQAWGVAATAKHYVANDSETDRFTVDVRVDERTLLADPLKREWGFDGVVVSDWSATRSTEASARAALDLVMPGPHGPWGGELVAAVRQGRVPEAAVDDKVRRLLRLAARMGALTGVDPTAPAPERPSPPARTSSPGSGCATAGGAPAARSCRPTSPAGPRRWSGPPSGSRASPWSTPGPARRSPPRSGSRRGRSSTGRWMRTVGGRAGRLRADRRPLGRRPAARHPRHRGRVPGSLNLRRGGAFLDALSACAGRRP